MLQRSLLLVAFSCLCCLTSNTAPAADRPNILWITAEDLSPDLACYGDLYADTPRLDAFAQQALRYTRAFATAPVCSPARSCLITGVYATSLGTQRLRSAFPIPGSIRGFPAYLRAAGYFTTNNVKTDYNIAHEAAFIKDAWNLSTARAHWRDRPDPTTPFFSVFNLMTTHQSRTSVYPYEQFQTEVQSRLEPARHHDPARALLPPYYPDIPSVRETVARYYDCISVMDAEVGEILDQLEADGLAESTIVFFYGDHGRGLPRGKRVLHDTGLQVPLLVRIPTKFRHFAPEAALHQSVDRLVSFVDFAPTVLNLAGLPAPQHMQGLPFLGPDAATPRQYAFGARDRVDEAIDLSRSVRDDRYLYLRNFMPHLSWMPPERYSDASEMRRDLLRLRQENKLDPAALTYAAPTRAAEELYDTQTDPHQVHNLADSPEHQETLARLRNELKAWMARTQDLGFLPESDAWQRLEAATLYGLTRPSIPLARIHETAWLVGLPETGPTLLHRLTNDPDPAVRYWSIVGLEAPAAQGIDATEPLLAALDDPSPALVIEAASALAARQLIARALPSLAATLKKNTAHPEILLQAVRALELMGSEAQPTTPLLRQVLQQAQAAEAATPPADPCWMFVRFSAEAALERAAAASSASP